MSSVDHQNFISSAKWDTGNPLELKAFANKNKLPGLAKVIKGQYAGVGASKSSQDFLYVHAVQPCAKILAEGVKINGKRTEQKFSIPLTYQGWFEVMSEDRKQVRPISSVQELAKLSPKCCLVRENFKAVISEPNSELISLDNVRIVHAGEKLTVQGDFSVTVRTQKGPVDKRFIRCKDEKGGLVFLDFEVKAMFSQIAGESNISGVHKIDGLLEKFRLPFIVHLVHGVIPAKIAKKFIPIFRLLGVYSEETAFVIPLRKDCGMLTISTREQLTLIGAENIDAIRGSNDFKTINSLCSALVNSYKNTIHVLVAPPDPDAVARGSEHLRRKQLHHQSNGATPDGGQKTNDVDNEEDDLLFEEIEEIYRYVRQGGDPPKPKVRSQTQQKPKVPPAQPQTKTTIDVKNTSSLRGSLLQEEPKQS